jgi:hypothetical protein
VSEENGRKRTIDERLDALLTRHEALAQTVELIAGMQLKVEEEQLKLVTAQSELTASQAKTEKHVRSFVKLAKHSLRGSD